MLGSEALERVNPTEANGQNPTTKHFSTALVCVVERTLLGYSYLSLGRFQLPLSGCQLSLGGGYLAFRNPSSPDPEHQCQYAANKQPYAAERVDIGLGHRSPYA